MKRVLVAAMLLLVTGSVFATDVNVYREKGKQGVKAAAVKNDVNREVRDIKYNINPLNAGEVCSLTITAGIEVGFFDFSIACSGSSAVSCKDAIAKALKCIKQAKKALEEEFM